MKANVIGIAALALMPNATLTALEKFDDQAEKAKQLFTKRKVKQK